MATVVKSNLPATVKQPATPAKPVAPATPAAPRGIVTAARWGVCGKAIPGFVTVMPAALKALPLNAVITAVVPGNPKKLGSTTPYALYGFNGVAGQTTTLGAYINALTQPHNGRTYGGATMAYKHLAWDVNHRYVTIQGINGVAPATPVAPPAPAVAPAAQTQAA